MLNEISGLRQLRINVLIIKLLDYLQCLKTCQLWLEY